MTETPQNPPVGQIVIVRLTDQTEMQAEFDGVNWRAHLDDDPGAVTFSADLVASWRPVE